MTMSGKRWAKQVASEVEEGDHLDARAQDLGAGEILLTS